MKRFDYEVALNQLGVDKLFKLNPCIRYDLIPDWVQGTDFLQLFLPYLKIIGDSREQDKWIEEACHYYQIAFEWAKKDKKEGTENLKEGDYSFQMLFGNREFDFVGKVAYERKGSVSEFYGNCTADRDRIKREFDRFATKRYNKVVLMLEFGEKLTDLIGLKFDFRGTHGQMVTKDVHHTLYATVMSWKQPNNKNFDVIQSNSHKQLFWLFLQDCYYYFKNEIRQECVDKGLIEILD